MHSNATEHILEGDARLISDAVNPEHGPRLGSTGGGGALMNSPSVPWPCPCPEKQLNLWATPKRIYG